MKKRLKIKWKNLFILLLLTFFIIIFCIFTLKGINDLLDDKKNIEQTDELKEITEIKEIDDPDQTEIIEQEEIKKSDPYWDYIKMKLIDVDFKELKNINSSTVGWIQVNGTNINYPYVQTDDNSFYLNHSFDKSKNKAGWVFLDYRNNKTTLDKNNILYAHGRVNNTMFGSLKKVLKNNWLNNKDNHIVKISTENENTLWQVFSIYHIPETSDYLKINFEDNNAFLEFADLLLNRSLHDFNTTLNENDKILTLSTCYNETERMVLHAKLIKISKK